MIIKSGLKDLKEQIKEMSENKNENERPDEIVNLVENIFEFNDQNQNQQWQGPKVLTLILTNA